jgi:hypothetical protein
VIRIFLFLFCCLLPSYAAAAENPALQAAAIQEPFKEILFSTPDLAAEGGVRLIRIHPDRLALISVATVVPAAGQRADLQALTRIGAIKARTAILKFSHGVTVSTYRGSSEKAKMVGTPHASMDLSVFFQATKEEVHGRIEQLPIVGSWMDESGIYHVAVGKVMDKGKPGNAFTSRKSAGKPDLPPRKKPEGITGKPLFAALLHAAPVLRENGGVRIFDINGQQKAILSVASARIGASPAKAERVARIKAMQKLLAHEEGIELSSVEYLKDYESLHIQDTQTTHVMLSEFLSIQKESVAGLVRSLPVAARWTGSGGELLYVCIGRTWD